MHNNLILAFVVIFSFDSLVFAKDSKTEKISIKSPSAYDPMVEVECSFDAFVIEKDPKGLNVREAPDAHSKILGVISPAVYEKPPSTSRYLVKPELKVIGGKNGGFKVKEAHDNEGLLEEMTKLKARKMYSGIGWVSGKMLTIKSNATEALLGPSKESKILHKQNDQVSFDDIDGYKLLGCQGEWVFVEDLKMKTNNRYWLNRICGIQETTCDGV